MLELSKKLGVCLGITAALAMAACGDDDSSGDKGGATGDNQVACESDENCAEVEGKPVCDLTAKVCVEKKSEGESKCTADADCKDSAKPKCDTATGECKAPEGEGGEGGEGGGGEVKTCTGDTISCGDACVEYKTDMKNCGECGKTCNEATQECKEGVCTDKPKEDAECQDGMDPVCDEENNVVTCAEGKFSKSPCGDDVCNDGKCEPKQVDAECDASEAKTCDGNKVKFCNDQGKYDYKDCGTKACDETTLDCSTEEFTAECQDSDAPSCTEANETKKCSNGKWVIQSCGDFKCANGECSEETIQAECSSEDKPSCTDDGKLQSCVNGKLVAEDCPSDPSETVCKADAESGIASCVPKEAECPADWTGDKTADSDGDGVLDCLDACPNAFYKSIDDGCKTCDKVKITFGSKSYCATVIQTAKEFIAIRDDIMSGKLTNTQNDAYVLVKDIDFGHGEGSVFKLGKHEWNSVSEFKGILTSLNGAKTISYTTDGTKLGTLECEGTNGCGLFNRLTSAKIGDIKLNFNVKGPEGKSYVGALAGYVNSSTLKNISVTGNVEGSASYIGGVSGLLNGSSVSNVSHDGNVTNGKFNYTGGIFGIAKSSTISSLNSKGEIKASRAHMGGVFGRVESCSLADITADCNVEDVVNQDDYDTNNRRTYSTYGGVLSGSATNTSVKNATCSGSIKGSRVIGGCIGEHAGNMMNITNNAKVTIYNDTTSWASYSGGVAGNVSGGYTFENITNNGEVTCDVPVAWNDRCRRTGGVFGVIGSSRAGSTVKNVVNKGSVTVIKNGSSIGGIIGDAYSVNLENVINEGDVNCVSSACGGIAGYYTPYAAYNHKSSDETSNPAHQVRTYGDWFVPDINVTNVVNKGAITSTSSYVGGIFGQARYHGANIRWEGLFNEGDVTATTYTGGLVGMLDWGDHVTGENKKIALNLTLDKCYNIGEIQGTERVGGLFGYLDTRHKNGYFESSNNYVRERCQKSDGTWVNGDWRWQWRYADVDATVRIVNSYAAGIVTGSTYVGGMIGYAYGNNEHVNGNLTVDRFSDDGLCTKTTPSEKVSEFTRTGKIVIENSYTSAQVNVIGSSGNVGGLIGYTWYKDTAETGVKHSFQNVYTTSPLPISGGKVLGAVVEAAVTPSLIEFKNTYYWDQSGPSKIVASTGATITGVTPFDYTDKVPKVGDDSLLDTLLDKMDKIKDAEEWKEKDVQIGAVDKTIPSFEFAPVEWQNDGSSEGGEEGGEEEGGR